MPAWYIDTLMAGGMAYRVRVSDVERSAVKASAMVHTMSALFVEFRQLCVVMRQHRQRVTSAPYQ